MAQQEDNKISSSETEDVGLFQRFRLWLGSAISGRNLDNSLKQSLKYVLEEHEEDGRKLPPEEQLMLNKVLDFGSLEVRDIMTPRTDIKAVEYTISLEDMRKHLIEYRHTRIPVYNDTLDNIKGFLHIKDLLPLMSANEFNMALVLRELLFVPPSMMLTNLLVKMRDAGVHMAIVVDEYGGTDGLVTLEDIFEEIVGEIQDEHDEDELEEPLVWTEAGFCDLDARVIIERIEKELEINLSTEDDEDADYDTLGGLIFYQTDHVPVSGEIIEYKDIRFEILSADPRLIKQVRIFKPQ